LQKEAEQNNESPISGSLKFLFEQKRGSTKQSQSPIKSAMSAKLG